MKRKRIITGIIVGLAVVAVAGAGVLYSQGVFGKSSKASSATTYQVVKLTTGDLEKSVTGTGTLSTADSTTETSPVELEIDSVAVTVGQSVKAGDTLATVDQDTLSDQIATLQSSISSIDSTLNQMTASQASTTTLTPSASGRVKKILCSAGDSVQTDIDKSNGLLLLSTDGKMKLDCALLKANTVTVGKKVKVTTGGSIYTGLVEAIAADGNSCTVTLSDNGPALGASAVVKTTGGTKLGSGKLQVNRPYLVTATAGSVSKIYVSLNQKVSNRTKLLYLVGVPLSDSYSQQVKTRADDAATLKTALALQKTGKLTAAEDGIIQTVAMADVKTIKQDDALVTMLTGGAVKLDVSVDELDIDNVTVGQAASVAVDAITDKTFDGTVEAISQIGTTSSGVTTYKVTLKLSADDALKVGMNATATIVIEKHSGVLLLPIEALNTLQGKQYVWLYTGTLPTDSTQDPGTKTIVTTGMSNDSFVEIASGLTSADQVVVVRTKSSSSTTTSQQSGMMIPGMDSGSGMQGNPPSGGQGGPPSGN